MDTGEIPAECDEWLKEKFSGNVLPDLTVLEMEIDETENKYEALFDEYHELEKTIKKLENLHEKLERYHALQIQEQNLEKSKGK